MTIQEFKQDFDQQLSRYLRQKVEEYQATVQDEFLTDLLQHAVTIVLSGGKRVRPYIASLLYGCAGGSFTPAVSLALLTLELLHAYALIHDDIIDQGTMRHNVSTVHCYALEQLKHQKRTGNLKRIAEAQALLVGNLFHSWAHEVLSLSCEEGQNFRQTYRYFAQQSTEVVMGQMIDVDITSQSQVSAGYIERKMLLKTASYTFIYPMKIGVALAGGDDALFDFCDRFGRLLGLAYQNQDDLLAYTVDITESGKSFSDIPERQHTLITNYIFEHGTPAQKKTLQRYWGKTVSDAAMTELRTLFADSGALHYAQQKSMYYFSEARMCLATIKMSKSARQSLNDFVDLVESRRS